MGIVLVVDDKMYTESDFSDDAFKAKGQYDFLQSTESILYGRLLTPAERIEKYAAYINEIHGEDLPDI